MRKYMLGCSQDIGLEEIEETKTKYNKENGTRHTRQRHAIPIYFTHHIFIYV